MIRINYFAIALLVVVAFIASSVWYSPLMFGREFTELNGVSASAHPNWLKIVCELIRTFVLAYVITRLVLLLNVANSKDALRLGIWLWIGFPVILLTGSILWQNVPWMLAAIHAGDWLIKILLFTGTAGWWGKDRRGHAPVQTADSN
jgi:Protein of unknown function (DUF1761)